ncbi:uncharacterized protein LOC129720824 [Wyeomyia smithii]|uniref:uncharacterized protein LOC129720824 n=1 Tax=Wyeomyia smithii TaxID=174621 RepID=UPI0024680926|nr:uncharacterized protein LOC129720824 [Wyeomyia smithii]
MATSVNSRSESTGGILGPRKTLIIMVTVVGCIAILWPKVFYPMMVGPGQTKNVIKDHRGPGCCDVVLDQETFANMSIVASNQQNLFRKRNIGPVVEDISIRQERPPHLRPETIHPAMRERGRAIPQAGSIHSERPSSPPRIVEGRPGPIPGMRPPMGAGSHQPTKSANSMGFIMPLYTIGIVSFFIYTILKLVFKKTPTAPYPEIKPDPAFRNEVFSTEQTYIKRPDSGNTKLGQPISGTENGVPASAVPVPCTGNGHSVQAEISGDYEKLAAKAEEHPATADLHAVECEQKDFLEQDNSVTHALVDEPKNEQNVTSDEYDQPKYDPTIEKVDDGFDLQRAVQHNDEQTSGTILAEVASQVVQEVLQEAGEKVDEVVESVAIELVESVIEQAEAFVVSERKENDSEKSELEICFRSSEFEAPQDTNENKTAIAEPEGFKLSAPLQCVPNEENEAQLYDNATIAPENEIKISSVALEQNISGKEEVPYVAEVSVEVAQATQTLSNQPVEEREIETTASDIVADILELVDQVEAAPVAWIESKSDTEGVEASDMLRESETFEPENAVSVDMMNDSVYTPSLLLQTDNIVTEKTEETETIGTEPIENDLQAVEAVKDATEGEIYAGAESDFAEQIHDIEAFKTVGLEVVENVLEKVSVVSEFAFPEQVTEKETEEVLESVQTVSLFAPNHQSPNIDAAQVDNADYGTVSEKEIPTFGEGSIPNECSKEVKICEIELEISPDEEETAIKTISSTLDEAMVEQEEEREIKAISADLETEVLEQVKPIADDEMAGPPVALSTADSQIDDHGITADDKENITDVTTEIAPEIVAPTENIKESLPSQEDSFETIEVEEEITFEIELEASPNQEEITIRNISATMDEAVFEQIEEQEIRAIAEDLVTEIIEQAEQVAIEKSTAVITEISNLECSFDNRVDSDETIVPVETNKDVSEVMISTKSLSDLEGQSEVKPTEFASSDFDSQVPSKMPETSMTVTETCEIEKGSTNLSPSINSEIEPCVAKNFDNADKSKEPPSYELLSQHTEPCSSEIEPTGGQTTVETPMKKHVTFVLSDSSDQSSVTENSSESSSPGEYPHKLDDFPVQESATAKLAADEPASEKPTRIDEVTESQEKDTTCVETVQQTEESSVLVKETVQPSVVLESESKAIDNRDLELDKCEAIKKSELSVAADHEQADELSKENIYSNVHQVVECVVEPVLKTEKDLSVKSDDTEQVEDAMDTNTVTASSSSTIEEVIISQPTQTAAVSEVAPESDNTSSAVPFMERCVTAVEVSDCVDITSDDAKLLETKPPRMTLATTTKVDDSVKKYNEEQTELLIDDEKPGASSSEEFVALIDEEIVEPCISATTKELEATVENEQTYTIPEHETSDNQTTEIFSSDEPIQPAFQENLSTDEAKPASFEKLIPDNGPPEHVAESLTDEKQAEIIKEVSVEDIPSHIDTSVEQSLTVATTEVMVESVDETQKQDFVHNLERQTDLHVHPEEQDKTEEETVPESIITTEDLNDTRSNDPVIYNGDETSAEVVVFSDDTAECHSEKMTEPDTATRSTEGLTIEEIVDDNVTATEEGKTIDEFIIKLDVEKIDTSEIISEVVEESIEIPCTTRGATILDVISENQEELQTTEPDVVASSDTTSNEQETEETDNREAAGKVVPKSNGHLVETLDSTIESDTNEDEQQNRLPDTDEEAPTKTEKQHQHETGAVPKKREPSEDRGTLKVIPMEKKAKYEMGRQSSRPGTPLQSVTLDSALVEAEASDSKCILLDSKAPQTSKVVVADPDLSIETLDATHKHDEEAPFDLNLIVVFESVSNLNQGRSLELNVLLGSEPTTVVHPSSAANRVASPTKEVVLSGKMKLSLVKLDDNDKSSSSATVTEVKDSAEEKDDTSREPLSPMRGNGVN